MGCVSGKEEQSIPMSFHNACGFPVNIFWSKDGGEEVLYSNLRNGDKYDVDTYFGHRWVVRNMNGQVIQECQCEGPCQVQIFPNLGPAFQGYPAAPNYHYPVASAAYQQPTNPPALALPQEHGNYHGDHVPWAIVAPANGGVTCIADTGDACRCKVCFEGEPQALLQPCGHAGFCWACASQLRQCPMCRAVVTQRIRMYL